MKASDELLKIRRRIEDKQRGIYFLLQDEEVVYVGKCVNGLARLTAHKTDKKFNYFCWLDCPNADDKKLLQLETKYILKYLPKYNGRPSVMDDKYMAASAYYLSVSTDKAMSSFKEYVHNSKAKFKQIGKSRYYQVDELKILFDKFIQGCLV